MKINVAEMDEYTLKRWSALMEGVQLIAEQGKKQGLTVDNIDFKQNYLVDYIDERTERIRLV